MKVEGRKLKLGGGMKTMEKKDKYEKEISTSKWD